MNIFTGTALTYWLILDDIDTTLHKVQTPWIYIWYWNWPFLGRRKWLPVKLMDHEHWTCVALTNANAASHQRQGRY